jgi:hypothetical protein
VELCLLAIKQPRAAGQKMPPLDSCGADNPTVHCEQEPGLISPDWQETFHRVFLYLQTLKVPEEKALELTREALRLASNNQRDSDSAGSPSIPEAMRALRELLTKQLSLLKKESFSQKDVFLHENLKGLSSMPPLNRGFMVPNTIDLIPWRTFLVHSFKKAVTIVSRPLNFLILFIFLILLFVLLTLWK